MIVAMTPEVCCARTLVITKPGVWLGGREGGREGRGEGREGWEGVRKEGRKEEKKEGMGIGKMKGEKEEDGWEGKGGRVWVG